MYLDKATGHLNGTAPDVDATYEFGIRVIDEHGKYADQTFTIDTRGKHKIDQTNISYMLPFLLSFYSELIINYPK